MFRFGLLLILWAVFVSVTSSGDFPADVQRCTYSDEECLCATITQFLRTHYSKGHHGLNIIPFDPLHIKSLVLKTAPDSPVNIAFNFKDIDLSGISQATITKVKGFTKEPSNLVLELQAHLPKLTLNGPYSVDGRVLILPIVGQGNSKIEFDNTIASAKVKCTTVEKDGKMHLNIVKIHLDLQPKNIAFNLENLFNGDKTLADTMNQFLNENWETVYLELKPVIIEAMSKILIHIANGAFAKFPYTDLFLPS